MDRTIVSFSIPNIITINAMAWGGFLLVVLIYQMFFAKSKGPHVGPTGSDSNSPAGF